MAIGSSSSSYAGLQPWPLCRALYKLGWAPLARPDLRLGFQVLPHSVGQRLHLLRRPPPRVDARPQPDVLPAVAAALGQAAQRGANLLPAPSLVLHQGQQRLVSLRGPLALQGVLGEEEVK